MSSGASCSSSSPLGSLYSALMASTALRRHVRVAVLQAGQDGGDERLQDLLLPDAAQEAQGHAPDVLRWGAAGCCAGSGR